MLLLYTPYYTHSVFCKMLRQNAAGIWVDQFNRFVSRARVAEFLQQNNIQLENARVLRPRYTRAERAARKRAQQDAYNARRRAARQAARAAARVSPQQIVNQKIAQIQRFQAGQDQELTLNLNNMTEDMIKQILRVIGFKPLFVTTLSRGDQYYPITADFRDLHQRIGQILQVDNPDSFEEVFSINGDHTYVLHQRPIQPNQIQRRNGNFFAFLNHTKINLTKYGVFSNIDPQNYKNNCLQIALNHAGIPESQTKSLIIGRDVPFVDLPKICNILKIKIELKTIIKSEDRPIKTLKFGNEGPLITLGHIQQHYFINEKTEYTKYSIEHYEHLKDKENFGYFYNDRQRDKQRCASSFDIIKLCLDKQLFLKMTQTDALQTTQYYDFIDQHVTEITESETAEHKAKETKPQDLKKIFFADFETTTEEEKHKPFMCCVISHDGKQKKTFYGDLCALDLMNFLPNDSMIYFHNLGYDSVFLVRFMNIRQEIREGTHCKMICGTYQSKKLVFKDSYAMISSPLRDFSKMFNLTVKKEIMPYSLYTKNNVSKQTVLFSEALQHIKTEDKEEFKIVSKDYVVNDLFNHIDYARFYCMQDCEVLAQGFKTFAGWINEAFNVSVYNFVSLPSLANECFVLNDSFNGCVKLSGVMRDFIQQSVLGGRCMVSENKKLIREGHISDFDAVSLYPSAIAQLGYLKGKPKILTNKQLQNEHILTMDFLNKQDGYFIEIKNIVCRKYRKFPLLPMKDDKGTLQYVNHFPSEYCATVNKITLEDLIKYQDITFTIIKGVYFNEGRNFISQDFIKECFEQRKIKKAEKNNIEKVYKLLMNASYGKTIEKPRKHKTKFSNSEARHKQFLNTNHNYIDEFTKICEGKYSYKVRNCISNHFSSPHIGSEILAMSKRIMNSVMCLAEDLNIEIFYQDTDSMHLFTNDIPRLADAFQEHTKSEIFPNGKVLIGENLGQFHTDFSLSGASDVHATKSIFIGKKCYVDFLEGVSKSQTILKGEHIRLKGVPYNSVIDAAKLNGNIEQVYMDLYNGEEVTFNLLAGSVRFKRNKDYSYSNVLEFNRSVSF